MRLLRSILCAVALALLAIGCAPHSTTPSPARDAAPPRSELTVDRATYAPGDSLIFLFRPNTDVGYNLCGAPIERHTESEWTPYLDYLKYTNVVRPLICHDVLYFARAGETVRYPIRLSEQVPPGTYRFKTGVERMDGNRQLGRETLTSETFVIARR